MWGYMQNDRCMQCAVMQAHLMLSSSIVAETAALHIHMQFNRLAQVQAEFRRVLWAFDMMP